MSLIVSRSYSRKREKIKEIKKKIKINSKEIEKEMRKNEINMNHEIICLKLFHDLFSLFYKINKDKESFEGLDEEYVKILMNEYYKEIINLFNKTRDLIFYLLFYRFFAYNENIKPF